MKTTNTSDRGFTLIEMLIVIGIMLIMVAAAATLMQPASEARRIREAGRAINIYLSSARNRAMQLRRPCGVVFRSFSTTTSGFAMNADQCEVPPCYCGDADTSAATLKWTNVPQKDGTKKEMLIATLDAEPTKMAKPGDFVQFNCQGPFYTIAPTDANTDPPTNPVDSDGYVTGKDLTLVVDSNQLTPWTTTASPSVPYRIFRSPMKAGATPLQLPTTAVVDLEYSGCLSLGPPGHQDFAIVFSPTGAVELIYYGASRQLVNDPIYLLVGKRKRVENQWPPPPQPARTLETEFTNVEDLNNVWVTINAGTGLVNTEPLATGAADAYYAAYAAAKAAGLSDDEANLAGKKAARNAAASLAMQGQGMGGN